MQQSYIKLGATISDMKILWKSLFIAVLASALWFAGSGCYGLYHYFRLSAEAPTFGLQWRVVALSESQYVMEASYLFSVKGEEKRGKTIFTQPVYLNSYSAQSFLKEWESSSWHVWYRPSDPSINSLEKRFPLKKVLRGAGALAIAFYFCGLIYFYREKISKVR